MKVKLLLLPVVFSAFFFITAKAQVDVGDSLALVDLYNSTNGSGWINKANWLTSNPVGTWWGVTVTNNRVTRIYLYENNLTGTLPSSLGNLDQLTDIGFPDNAIEGTLPSSLGNLVSLADMEFNNNKFSGEIPASYQNLIHIGGFIVDGNQLSGAFPAAVLSMKGLTFLSLSGNRFSGALPVEIKDLTSMRFMYLSNNKFSGAIPEIFDSLQDMEQLNLSSNQFTGHFPESFRRQVNLFDLDIHNNQLSGTLPAWLGEMKALYGLDVSYNNFSGQIPASIKKYPFNFGFLVFNFSHNHFTLYQNLPFSKRNIWYEADISYNNFTFNIESLVKSFRPIGLLTYSPQANIPIHQHGKRLAVSAGGYLIDNAYHWFKVGFADSVNIGGDSAFTPPSDGFYYAKVTNLTARDLTLYTDTFAYTAPSVSTVNVFISPNPVSGILHITGLSEKSDAKITIADMGGYVWIRADSHQQSAVRIDVSRLKAGNYLVNVSDGKTTKTIQFVKE